MRPLPNQERVSQKKKKQMNNKIITESDYVDDFESILIDTIVDMRDYFNKEKSIYEILEEKAEREVA